MAGKSEFMVHYWDKVEIALGWSVVGGGVGFVVGLLATAVFGCRCLCFTLAGWTVASATVTAASYAISTTFKIKCAGRAVIVTGCDTGFGHALAKHLDTLGFTVFAGCYTMNGQGASSLKRRATKRLHVIQLDVTSDEQIAAAERYVRKHLPQKGLWGIVNNAGCASYGEVEWVTLDTYKTTMDINVLGIIRMCQTFLPMVRVSKGRVVNMASGLARMAMPMRSAYVTSKYAVAGLTECLRMEMKSWGVHVSIIEPGNYISGTNIFTRAGIEKEGSAMWNSMSDSLRKEYGRRHFDVRVDQMKGYSGTGMRDISAVVQAFTSGLVDKFPQVRYQPMELYFKIRCFVSTHLPPHVYDYLYITNLNRN